MILSVAPFHAKQTKGQLSVSVIGSRGSHGSFELQTWNSLLRSLIFWTSLTFWQVEDRSVEFPRLKWYVVEHIVIIMWRQHVVIAHHLVSQRPMRFSFGNEKAVSVSFVISSVFPFVLEAWHSSVHFFRNKLKVEKVNVKSFHYKICLIEVNLYFHLLSEVKFSSPRKRETN